MGGWRRDVPGLGQHNISSSTSGVRRALDSHTHIGVFESRGVVHTIPSHAGLVPALAQSRDDQELFFGEGWVGGLGLGLGLGNVGWMVFGGGGGGQERQREKEREREGRTLCSGKTWANPEVASMYCGWVDGRKE